MSTQQMSSITICDNYLSCNFRGLKTLCFNTKQTKIDVDWSLQPPKQFKKLNFAQWKTNKIFKNATAE